MDFQEKISSLLKGRFITNQSSTICFFGARFLLEYSKTETRTFVLFLVRHQIDLETPVLELIYFSKKFQTRRCYDFCQVDLSIGQDYRKSLGVSDLLRSDLFFCHTVKIEKKSKCYLKV